MIAKAFLKIWDAFVLFSYNPAVFKKAVVYAAIAAHLAVLLENVEEKSG